MRVTFWLCGALASLVLVAGCGGGDGGEGGGTSAPQTASEDATAAVLAAYERLRTSSFRATVEQTISFDAGDAPSQLQQLLSASSGTTTSQVEAERGGSRVRGLIDNPQLPRDFTIVLYDGETFVEAGGSEFVQLGGSLGELFGDLANIGSEELARALEDVTDEGPATVDGRQVQRYTATLSPEYTDELTDRVLGGFGVDASQVDLSVREATQTVDLLPDGGLAHQAGTAVIEIDLTELAGSETVVVQTTTTDQTVRDAGAAITVAKPEASREITGLQELGAVLS